MSVSSNSMHLRSHKDTNISTSLDSKSINSNGNVLARKKRGIKPSNAQTARTAANSKPSKIPKPTMVNETHKCNRDFDVISKQMESINDEISNMKISFTVFQRSIQTSINSVNDTINKKGRDFDSIVNAMKSEMHSIREKIQMGNAMVKPVCTSTVPMEAQFASILFGAGILQLEEEYGTQIERLQNKVTELEEANKRTEEMTNDLVTSITSFMDSDSNSCTSNPQRNNVFDEKIADIENSIECIQHEVNRLNLSTSGDGEKIIKMNRQLHVLSSKYVGFNTKISHYLNDFNRINIEKLYPDNIIDSDAKPFMIDEEETGDETNSNPTTKRRSDVPMVSNRFTKPYDVNAYARTITIEIRETNIDNLQQHQIELKGQCEMFFGKQMVKNATLTGYQLNGTKITSIRYVLEFEIPLNYQYIDHLKFPTNWFFHIMRTSWTKKRSVKHRVMRQRM